jgi:nitrite reductase/ring-hydroxylating ferredoxin subunit
MSEKPLEVPGPDFRLGVRLADFDESVPLGGHVAGEAAVAVRCGDEVFVVGGMCTHRRPELSRVTS